MVINQVESQERREREKDENKIEVTTAETKRPYEEVIGSLLYLANRVPPDISYAVNDLSRHQIIPTDEEWKIVKRVEVINNKFEGKLDYLQGFSDVSFADCKSLKLRVDS